MKHFERLKVEKGGYQFTRLLDQEGHFVVPFDEFTTYLMSAGYSQNTISRYGDVVAVFLDYLTEAGVYGRPATHLQIKESVERYISIRLTGRGLQRSSRAKNGTLSKWDKIAADLDLKTLSRGSLENTKAAINLFLQLSAERYRLEVEEAVLRGVKVNVLQSPRELFDLRHRTMSAREHSMLVKRSMLASVTRHNPQGISVSEGYLKHRSTSQSALVDQDHMAFPTEMIAPLIAGARSCRDRAYWLLLVGTGLRSHEAEQINWKDVDIERRLVFVHDPEKLRYSNTLPGVHKLRFKGRTVSQTFFVQPFRDQFFDALEEYVRFEAFPCANHGFVFQDIRTGFAGRPFYQLSDASKVKALAKACDNAGVPRKPSGARYGRHSLRHWYGVFLLNFLPLPDGFGLRIDEVQRLMGHKDRKSTEKYAREDKLILESKLEAADAILSSRASDIRDLREIIAGRYEHSAEEIRRSMINDQPLE
ncbi:site-specific integrase [Tropicibacter sp. Alg240-R139]|uniref:tyrosine-type recombinase/integrase n=1 Tax=Tropicibacter sp. Alg240-R139 TaxID=2305991 RepID=UPI0013DF5346|nr:site-specific integrase [Tropicibacter sp. Alg240-R139]